MFEVSLKMKKWTGKTIGNYTILEKLGAGADGEVYKAKHVILEKTVAIKFLNLFTVGDETKQQSLERFLREGRAIDRKSVV